MAPRRRELQPDLDALRASKKRLDATRNALQALSAEERGVIFVEMESELGINSKGSQTSLKPSSNAPTKDKASGKKKPSLAAEAEAFICAREGVRTHEVAKHIKQSVPNAFGTLRSLLKQGRVARHGTRNLTLWTAPGAKPTMRVETIAAAIMKVVTESDTPVDGRLLRETVTMLVTGATGKKPREESITAELYRLAQRNMVHIDGANENGPKYTGPKGGEPAALN